MMLVAERHRLIARHVLMRDIGRACDLIGETDWQDRGQHRAMRAERGDGVGAGTENLHASVPGSNELFRNAVEASLTANGGSAGGFHFLRRKLRHW